MARDREERLAELKARLKAKVEKKRKNRLFSVKVKTLSLGTASMIYLLAL